MKKTIAIILIIAIALFGAALGFSALAKANTQKEHIWLMETLLPGGKDFQKVAYDGEDANIRSIHQCDAGFIVETVTQGYADEIVMFIGVDNDGTVTGLVAHEAHETPGLGNQILTDHAFLSQFLNRSGTFTIGAKAEAEADGFSGATDQGASAGEEIAVDGISGATVSSKAVARCVTSAVAYVTGADAGSSATTWGG